MAEKLPPGECVIQLPHLGWVPLDESSRRYLTAGGKPWEATEVRASGDRTAR